MLKRIFTPADYAECLKSHTKNTPALETSVSVCIQPCLKAAETGATAEAVERESMLQQIEPKVIHICREKCDLFF